LINTDTCVESGLELNSTDSEDLQEQDWAALPNWNKITTKKLDFWLLIVQHFSLFPSLTSSYSYSSQNVSLILLRRALIMRCVLTEPERKKANSALNWIVRATQ